MVGEEFGLVMSPGVGDDGSEVVRTEYIINLVVIYFVIYLAMEGV